MENQVFSAVAGGRVFTWYGSMTSMEVRYSSTWTHKIYPFFGPFESVTISL